MTEPEDLERQRGPDFPGEDPPRRSNPVQWMLAAVVVVCAVGAWVIL